MMDFGDADRARKRRSKRSKARPAARCAAKKVKGGRWMAICPHKRPRFVSEAQAHAMNRGRRGKSRKGR